MQNIPEPEKKRDQNNIVNQPHQDMKAGVLLVNLGTPSSYAAADIRRYLRLSGHEWTYFDCGTLH